MLSRVTLSAFLCLSLSLLVSARNLVTTQSQISGPFIAFITRTAQFPPTEVEDDNETLGTNWRNTTTTAPGSYYEEDPPNYPHQLIIQLLQNFTPLPGLFDSVGNQADVVSEVHHNNLDLDLEIL